VKLSQPDISSLELALVRQTLEERHLSDGYYADQFAELFAEKFGFDQHYVWPQVNGTMAMYSTLVAMGVGPGDEIITTPYSFVATSNVILAVGATPVYVDILRDTYQIDPSKIAEAVTPRTVGCMPADIFGVACDIDGIRAAMPKGTWVLEDSIEAVGCTHLGKPVGYYADSCAFGFSPNKQLTTCDGGFVVTRDKNVYRTVKRMSHHGAHPSQDKQYVRWGLNLRISEMAAQLGIGQLARFDHIDAARQAVRQRYDAALAPKYAKQNRLWSGGNVTDFVYVIELPDGWTKAKFIAAMSDVGIPVKPYFDCLHRLPHLASYYRDLPVCDDVGNRTVALPFHTSLTPQSIDYVVEHTLELLEGKA
jgi:perosamine synthetase